MRGRDAWALDVRGYGLSWKPVDDGARPSASVADTAQALEDLTAAIHFVMRETGTDIVDLVGWSWRATVAASYAALARPVRIVERLGTPELRERIVPQAAAGELLVAISMSEPDAGTAFTDLKTRARFEGEEIVLNGTKRWCSGAGHSGGYVVFCRFDGTEAAKGIGAVFVEIGTPDLSFGEQEQLMGFRVYPRPTSSSMTCTCPRHTCSPRRATSPS